METVLEEVVHRVVAVDDQRLHRALVWLRDFFGHTVRATPLAGDASARRYFRIDIAGGESGILMDAPPPHCAVEPFLRIRAWLEQGGVRVPKLIAHDMRSGFLLLEDLGDTTWAKAVEQGASADLFMADAMEQLLRLQALDGAAVGLSDFDHARMRQECALYVDWYVPHQRGVRMSERDRERFLSDLEPLFSAVSEQPQLPVHLDWHSRNLMVPGDGLSLAVIDFQDACIGPVGYDMASLIYDCYQHYDESTTQRWSQDFYSLLPRKYFGCYQSWEHWHQSLLLTSLQRHIKVCGIFVRLAVRDGKKQFLNDLPQTRSYLIQELDALPEIAAGLRPWLLDSGP